MAGIKPEAEDPVTYLTQKVELKKYLNENRAGTPASVDLPTALSVIQADCRQLIADISAATGEAARTILLLLDDLHRYTGLASDIINQSRQYGLGTVALPIPLAFTYTAAGTDGRSLQDELRKRGDIRSVWLGAWETPIEQQLAFRQFILSWFKCSVSSRSNKSEQVALFYELMLEYTRGRPGLFGAPEIRGLVGFASGDKTLLDADFETSLQKWT